MYVCMHACMHVLRASCSREATEAKESVGHAGTGFQAG